MSIGGRGLSRTWAHLHHCYSLALADLEAWSDQNPGHMPIMVVIEIKDTDEITTDPHPPLEPWGPADYNRLDAEIRSVMGNKLATPDDLQGACPTLESAVEDNAWPTLVASSCSSTATAGPGVEQRNLQPLA